MKTCYFVFASSVSQKITPAVSLFVSRQFTLEIRTQFFENLYSAHATDTRTSHLVIQLGATAFPLPISDYVLLMSTGGAVHIHVHVHVPPSFGSQDRYPSLKTENRVGPIKRLGTDFVSG